MPVTASEIGPRTTMRRAKVKMVVESQRLFQTLV